MDVDKELEDFLHAHLVNIQMFYGKMDDTESYETNQAVLIDGLKELLHRQTRAARIEELETIRISLRDNGYEGTAPIIMKRMVELNALKGEKDNG